MVAYAKPWLSIEDQAQKLFDRGLEAESSEQVQQLLRRVGYYRLTGYLYPYRNSEMVLDSGRERVRVLNDFRPGTRLQFAADLIDFDRSLRLLVLEGVERLEVALRMQLGYILGRSSAFAHQEPSMFLPSFTTGPENEAGVRQASNHELWIARARSRQDESDEAFVAHFRVKYEDQMPIWALTEILEMGQLSRLYAGLQNVVATEVASALGAPTKKILQSWIASLNYVRNVAAHHARLYNRKLVTAPSRPKVGQVPALDHLRDGESAKSVFGLYNALAVLAYLLSQIDPTCGWAKRVSDLIETFPDVGSVTVESTGLPKDWQRQALWAPS